MKTYSIGTIQKAFFELVDTEKYVKFSLYMKNRKPIKVKAKISEIWASSKGLVIVFNYVFVKRQKFPDLRILTRDIRWIDQPFDESKFEELCNLYQKKLDAPKEGSGILT